MSGNSAWARKAHSKLEITPAVKLTAPAGRHPWSPEPPWQPQEMLWQPLAPEVVNTKGRFGPEIYFGHTIAEARPGDDIRLVKYASSGTALYDD